MSGTQELLRVPNLAATAVLAGSVAAVLVPLARNRWWQARPARRRCLAGSAVALAAAYSPPVGVMAGALASAHMVQHLLLVAVAAPLVAVAGPGPMLLRSLPPPLRRSWRLLHNRFRPAAGPGVRRQRPGPAVAWSAHVVVLWWWHASAPYDAAVRHEGLHALEHATLAGTAVWFWHRVLGPAALRHSPALGLIATFAMALQSVFLSALLTFARTPWYDAYRTTTAAWDLAPLTDQQLAGLIMWIPAAAAHLAAGLYVLHRWIGSSEPDEARNADIRPQSARLPVSRS